MGNIFAKLTHLAYHLPEKRLDNAELGVLFSMWDENKIMAKTGIKIRHIAAPQETALDLGISAAMALLEQQPHLRERIDALFFCTESPDFCLPPNACIAQARLALRNDIVAFDYSLGCSGWVYGLAFAQAHIAAGLATHVLLITAETYSKYLAEQDRSVRTIFGDGGAAVLIEASDAPHMDGFVFSTDGAGYNNLIVPASGAAVDKAICRNEEFSAEGRTPKNLYMNGPAIFQFTLECVPDLIRRCLAKSKKRMEDIDYFIFHQANEFMLKHLRSKCEIPEEKFIMDIEKFGNTVSSTIPIVLKNALCNGTIRKGDTILVVGFGVGYSSAACIMTL